MKYYIIKNQVMPWGDYGDILFTGFLNVIDKNFNDLKIPELERVGPYLPEIYIANTRNIVVVDFLKRKIEQEQIKGISGFKHIIKKKIVNIDWQSWDKEKENPLFYPKSREPEDYILKGDNDKQLSESMSDVWEMDVLRQYELKKISDIPDNITFSDIALADNPNLDIFVPKNMLYIIVSEKFKILLESNNINTLRFIELLKI